MRFVNAGVLTRKALNPNLSCGPSSPKGVFQNATFLERKHNLNANASVLGKAVFRTLRLALTVINRSVKEKKWSVVANSSALYKGQKLKIGKRGFQSRKTPISTFPRKGRFESKDPPCIEIGIF